MGYIAFIATTLIWGTTFLFIGLGNDVLPPFWSATIRLVLATALLAALTVATRTPWPRGAALRAALAFGFLNFGINLALLYWGELRVPSGVAAILYASTPLTTVLMAAAAGLERLDRRRSGVALVAFLGVATIFGGELSLDVPLVPLLAVLVAAGASALASVILKVAPRQAAIPANAVGAAVGAAVCALVSVVAGEPRTLPATADGWLPILYLTVAGSVGAYVIYTWLITHWPATRASLVGVTAPVIAVAVGMAVRGERPSLLTFVGAALVLGSVVVGLRLPHAAPLRAAPR